MSNKGLANFSVFSMIKSMKPFLTGLLQSTTLLSRAISLLGDKKELANGCLTRQSFNRG
jgi:hypothetical protein